MHSVLAWCAWGLDITAANRRISRDITIGLITDLKHLAMLRLYGARPVHHKLSDGSANVYTLWGDITYHSARQRPVEYFAVLSV